MKPNNSRMRSCFLAALILAAVAAPAMAAPRTLAVTGQGSVPYEPDFVDLVFSVVTRAPGYAEAQTRNLTSVEAVMTTLVSRCKIERKDITSLDYHLAEDVSYENGARKLAGYLSSTRMRLRIRDIASYKTVLVALLDAGVNGIESVDFGVDDYAALREKALIAAYADAERMARAMATAAKAGIVRVLVLREAGGEQTPPVPRLKAMAADLAAGNGEVISSGTQLVEASVYVEFELR